VAVIGSIAMLTCAALLAVAVIRRTLQPLAQLADGVSSIDATALGSRFPTDGLPTELRPISERLNELLARLESAFERERAFSANAAHELRTPVAELRTLAEVALKWPESNAETLQAFGDARAIAEQMEGIVTGLATIARCESGAEPVHRESVALAPLLQKAWRPFATQAASKGQTLRLDVPESAVVDSDPALLEIIFANLFSNAVEHAPAGGEISVSTATIDGTMILQVANAATDLTAADVAHVFDRFWRKSAARTSQNRTGLGLSICHALAGLLRASLRAELEDGTFVISLALPHARTVSEMKPIHEPQMEVNQRA
jgi:two-component system sensor histidine kinase QseC